MVKRLLCAFGGNKTTPGTPLQCSELQIMRGEWRDKVWLPHPEFDRPKRMRNG
ncbi:hypothetical protein [Herminiimonas sp. CN]|uniref:hypothetical protein n=1 Tax=Herminiimonas sp. CN TaxID=1349818 RepID=UPI0012DE9D1D|nr:hypothetical protein [Herminiimonas sp. CN]